MQVDYIIVGQGICGTWLSYYLLKENKTVLVIDDAKPGTASKVASGIINPVTGRRVVATWMIDELLPFVFEAYNAFAKEINQNIIEQKNLIAFPAAADLRDAYKKRMQEQNSFIKNISAEKQETQKQFFNFIFECFEINPVYLINLHPLLAKWRAYLQSSSLLLEESFDESHLIIHENSVQYKNIIAQKIIYCNGIDAYNSDYWKNMPATFIKGEGLIAEIKDLPADNIYKIGSLTIATWYDGLWWLGSSYENDYSNPFPSDGFIRQKENELKMFLKTEVKIINHISGIRPASVERRPFVGFHPANKNIGLLNGMGTKGCSLAPWFAKQLADNLIHNKPIDPAADVNRFARLLAR